MKINNEIPLGSQINPPRREADTLDTEELAKLTRKYWSLISSQHDMNFAKGSELGKNHLQREEDVALSVIQGIIKVIFEEIKSQINSNSDLNFEKKQRQVMRANVICDTMNKQIDLVKALNFKLDLLALQAILQGYTTTFLLLKAHDYKN
mgnify:CR=1 FL=1